jgi:hypothetical protein
MNASTLLLSGEATLVAAAGGVTRTEISSSTVMTTEPLTGAAGVPFTL